MSATALWVRAGGSTNGRLGSALNEANVAVRVVEAGVHSPSASDLAAVSLVLVEFGTSAQMAGQTIRRIKTLSADTSVVIVGEVSQWGVEPVVEAMRAGAADVLDLALGVDAVMDKLEPFLRSPVPEGGVELVAEDERTCAMLNLAYRVAKTRATVLISGESGTGKEVFARYIHEQSGRHNGPFVAVNCAAIPDNMLESMLFGYEKGAFTGAYQSSPGKFEQAQRGTLLLDEISEMPLDLQAKLLRVLQESEVERLGGRATIVLDVRVLATTNRNLREEVAAGRFREDLFYRLNVFPLHMWPLRERPHDILPLARTSLRRHADPMQPLPKLGASAEASLLAYPWPGNVRELDNLIQRSAILCNGSVIEASDLIFEPDTEVQIPVALSAPTRIVQSTDAQSRLPDDLKTVEERMILDALHAGRGSRKHAAEQLGISPRTLRYKLARLREAGVRIPG